MASFTSVIEKSSVFIGSSSNTLTIGLSSMNGGWPRISIYLVLKAIDHVKQIALIKPNDMDIQRSLVFIKDRVWIKTLGIFSLLLSVVSIFGSLAWQNGLMKIKFILPSVIFPGIRGLHKSSKLNKLDFSGKLVLPKSDQKGARKLPYKNGSKVLEFLVFLVFFMHLL